MSVLLQNFARYRIRAILSLILIYVSIITEWNWLWGLLLLAWVVTDLRSGETWLSESVSRQHNPVLYFLIVLTWLLLGGYLVLQPVSNLWI